MVLSQESHWYGVFRSVSSGAQGRSSTELAKRAFGLCQGNLLRGIEIKLSFFMMDIERMQ